VLLCWKVERGAVRFGEKEVEEENQDEEGTNLVGESLPLDLVLEGLLQLLSTHEELDLPLSSVLSGDGLLHLDLVLLGENSGSLLEDLSIVTVLESPLAVKSEKEEESTRLDSDSRSRKGKGEEGREEGKDEHVGDGGLLEMLLQMMESVLGDVSDSERRVLLYLTLLGDGLSLYIEKEKEVGVISGGSFDGRAFVRLRRVRVRRWRRTYSKKLDKSGLSSSVGSEDTDSGREGKSTRDVVERGLGSSGVGEGAVGELHDGSGVGSNSHEGSGRREGEPGEQGEGKERSATRRCFSGRDERRDSLDGGGGEGVVRLGLGLLLDELGKVSLVVSELLGLVVDLRAKGKGRTSQLGFRRGRGRNSRVERDVRYQCRRCRGIQSRGRR